MPDQPYPWDREADPRRERCGRCGHNIRCHPTVPELMRNPSATCDPRYPGNEDATCDCPVFHTPWEEPHA